MHRDVLVIAYYYPPLGLSGVQRTLKFTKYLPHFGWQPTVLTIAPGGYYAYDESMLREAEEAGVSIIRTNSFDPTRLYGRKKKVKISREYIRKFMNRMSQSVFIPDNKIGWRRKAVRKAKKLLKEKDFKIIFSTAPPFTDHLIGRDIAARSGLPLVLDYRDAWLEYQYSFYPTPFHKLAHFMLEKSCARAARKIIVVNRQIKISLLKRYKFLDYNDVHIISHGYDPEDFRIEEVVPPNSYCMRITHTGTFIEDITPAPLLKALHKVLSENSSYKGRIKLTFAGLFRKEHESLIRKLGLQNHVELVGYLDHRECTKLMLQSDVLYVTLGNGKKHLTTTVGKLYDYLGARKPILASLPDGSARQTVLDSQNGILTEPGDVDSLAKAITQLFERFKRRELTPTSEKVVERYDRIHLTESLAQIFNSIEPE